MAGSAGRLFVAVPLPGEVREALSLHLRGAGEPLPGRVVPPANWHLTLRFLGDTPAAALELLRRELGGARLGGPFTLRFGGLGAFPRPARASALWLGVSRGERSLEALAAAVESACRRAGFPAETRPFAPHLTLSRLRPARDVRELVERTPPFDAEAPVREVVLYRSDAGRGPVRYHALERFELR